MLDHENEHEKALKTLASFPVSNLALHVKSKFAFQGIYMFEFCPKKFTNYTLFSTMFNTSRVQITINSLLILHVHVNFYPVYLSTKYKIYICSRIHSSQFFFQWNLD